MTLREFREKLPSLPEGERAAVIRNLYANYFNQVSKSVLSIFEKLYDEREEVKELASYFEQQNQVIITCIDNEVSPTGQAVRASLGLKPLTWDTEV